MENQLNFGIGKGEFMEEQIRHYFLELGYYVVRGVKYRYEGIDITDVDLFLYSRSSSITRERINVDIKNKKTPQVFERILWANGVRQLLQFDSCIVATTDQKPVIHKFGQLHNTTILDGTFIGKMRTNLSANRLNEEELNTRLAAHKSHKTFDNKDWRFLYEISKSRLLSEQDYAGFNSGLSLISYLFDKILTDVNKREDAIRLSYLLISHLLITIDYILKNVSFLNSAERSKKLSDGFKFGNLSKDGVDKIISIAVEISGRKSAGFYLDSLDDDSTIILVEFFSKNEIAKDLFTWARAFESLGFSRDIINPEDINSSLKGVIALFLDFFGIERRVFFESFYKKTINE